MFASQLIRPKELERICKQVYALYKGEVNCDLPYKNYCVLVLCYSRQEAESIKSYLFDSLVREYGYYEALSITNKGHLRFASDYGHMLGLAPAAWYMTSEFWKHPDFHSMFDRACYWRGLLKKRNFRCNGFYTGMFDMRVKNNYIYNEPDQL